MKIRIGVNHRFSLQFSTDHRNSGTFGSLAHQFRDTLATDCLNFLTFFSFFYFDFRSYLENFRSFREENWKWKANFQSRFVRRIFAREFSLAPTHSQLVVFEGKFIEGNFTGWLRCGSRDLRTTAGSLLVLVFPNHATNFLRWKCAKSLENCSKLFLRIISSQPENSQRARKIPTDSLDSLPRT